MTEIALLHQRLLDDLAASGTLSEPWHEAFAALSRHQFIPDTIWDDSAGELVPLRRADDPDRWLDAAYALDAVITQVDDGHPTGSGDRGRYITSSASRPDVVALMLAALDAQPGIRVLEIGTGTGYNAALLAYRLGAPNVTSVEIDPALAEHARTALAVTGYSVTVITGDGAQGYPPHAPYDRIIATAAVHQVPRPTLHPRCHRQDPVSRAAPSPEAIAEEHGDKIQIVTLNRQNPATAAKDSVMFIPRR